MEINQNTVSLRAYQATDIDDDILWLNREVDWIKLDTPWEAAVPVDEQEYREDVLAFIAGQKDDSGIASRLEISVGGKHVGFVTAYPLERKGSPLAVGIEICERGYRGKGVGEAALALEVKYLIGKGAKSLFLETHSKNAPMKRCAEKLGFSLIEREEAKWKAAGEAYDRLLYRLDFGLFQSRYGK